MADSEHNRGMAKYLAELVRAARYRAFFCQKHDCLTERGQCSLCIVENVFKTRITSIREIMSR